MAVSAPSNTQHILRLALHELRHGWRHFSIFVVCLMLGVAIMGSVGSFGALVGRALESEAKSLLGGDFEVRTGATAVTGAQRKALDSYGRVSSVTTLRSILYHGENSTLVEIKAVDEAYPLVGRLTLNEPVTLEEALAGNGVIVDAILLAQLDLTLGDTIQLGSGQYVIRATLKKEPDRAVQIFSFGPRVMMSHDSLKASGLVKLFSLVEHRYRVLTASASPVDEHFSRALEAKFASQFPGAAWRVQTGTDGNQTVERFTGQLLSFLTLSGLATFLIAGIGIGSSARAYLERKLQTIAVFKTLGATRRSILAIYMLVLAMLAGAGGLGGVALAIASVLSVVPLLTPVLPVLETQTSLSPWPLALAFWYGLLIVYLFSMPALLSALNIRPSILFRSRAGILLFRKDRVVWRVAAILAVLLLATLLLSARDKLFILGAIGVMAVAFAVFGACAVLVRRIARKLHVRKPWLQLALGNLHRPGSTTGTVIYAIGISLTVLIALTLTEANFQSRIRELVEEKAPTLFMIDIQPDQQDGLKALLGQYASPEQVMLYPMVRGRISAINGVAVKESEVDEDVRWAVRGDRGLSTSVALPPNARIAQGQWWPADYNGEPLLSVDQRFLKGMKLKLGDTLTLNILGEDITARIASARDIDYTTFQINFSMMLSPGALDRFPRTYLATVHLGTHADREAELVRTINRTLPGITIIRTAEIVNVVREIVEHIATALRVTVAISLFAGLLVLISALSATIEQRIYDTAVLKVLGARRRDILKSCTAEWMLLALITSAIAAIIGTLSSWLITLRFRGQGFSPMPEVTLATIAACIVVIWLTGALGNRRLFNLHISSLLRNE